MSTDWSSNGVLAVNTEDYEGVSSSLNDYSNISDDQTNNAIDWYFPVIDLCEANQWLLFENYISLNELNVSEICNVFKNKLLCELHTEIFLQHPFIVQKLIRWLNENKETDLVLECLNLLIDKVIKRHYESVNGLCEHFESIEQDVGCSNSQTISATNSDATTSDELLRWGIAKLCVSLMPTVLKHVVCNSDGAFSLFMSSIHLLSSISDNCNIKFYIELVFSNYSVKNLLLNEPLSSIKLLIIVKELSLLSGLLNEPFKGIIINILKEPYWIHLYPTLYHQLYEQFINEDILELKIIKMVENAYTLSTSSNLNLKQYTELLSNSLPIIWFHQKFDIIDKFIVETCKNAKSSGIKNEYSNILLNLLSFKSENVMLYTYSAINRSVKILLNNFKSKPRQTENLIKNLLCTNVLNEILCFGCVHSNEQVNQLASEIMERLLKSKNILTNDLWKCFLSNIAPMFPVLYCYSDKSSPFGQIVFNFFDPDQADKFNISRLMVLQSMILMLMSKDKKSRVEANNRITWLLQTTLNKSINLPSDLFLIAYDDLDEKLEEPVGIYTENDLNGMIDLISDECSSQQTIKCALYKISVMLEHTHLQQYFIQNGGMNIILNLLKTSKLFVNERGLLIALLRLILCFTKKNTKLHVDNLLANNYEIQLQLISVLSDFYEIPLVKQYILHIFVYCIFDQYLTHFGELPKVTVDKVLYSQIKIKKCLNSSNNHDDDMLFSNIKNNKNCMDVLILTWHLKHFNNIDSFLENGFATNAHNYSFNDVFQNLKKASIKWSVKKYLTDLSSAESHSVAIAILSDLKRYFELSVCIEQIEVDKELLEKALKKFLILPPILSADLQTLIIVLKLLNFALKKRVLINQFYWVADVLMQSELMHHTTGDNFKDDERLTQLCNQFYFELYEVYWLCLKNFNHFSTISLTKLLFNQLSTTKTELALLQVNMKCVTILTKNPKNIDYELIQMYLSQLISLKTILMNNSNEKSLQQSYLTILNHILHHTILEPKICEVWGVYDWETWTWSMIHSTDPLVRALVFQLSSGLAVIDIPMSQNLIQLSLNYFCESNCIENCVVAEQASIFCSNIFCNPKFKRLCHQYVVKLDFNTFVNIINMCSSYDCDKPEKKYFSTSPKLVANVCCMLFNMITLTEIDLHGFDQNCQFVHALAMCLKKYLTPVCIEKPTILEMCGRICSVLTLFAPVSNYNFENVLTYLNIIYNRVIINIDHCTTMVWRSVFQLTYKVIQFTNYKSFMITNSLVSVLLMSITSKNNDLCIDALNVISVSYSQLSSKLAYHICNILMDILCSEWNHKLKRKMLLVSLSNILFEHPDAYETAKQGNLLFFLISKLKNIQLQITKQLTQKSKTLQNDYLEIVGFFCNVFNGCVSARKDASDKLPDIVHKLWPFVVTNTKSELLICTLQMLISLTSNCPRACSAMTMTSSTVGVDPKTKSTSCSLFHEIISLSSDFHLSGDVLGITLILLLNCCQAQECRVIISKSKLLSNIVSILNLKDKKRSVKIEQKCLNFLLVFTSFSEGQINLLKVDYILDTLIDLLKSNYKNDSIAILRNLCFNVQNRVILLSSDVFLNGIKTLLEQGDLTNQQYKNISLAVWSVACNNQKARLQLRHWGIDKYFEKSSDILLGCDKETQNVMNCTYQVLKN